MVNFIPLEYDARVANNSEPADQCKSPTKIEYQGRCGNWDDMNETFTAKLKKGTKSLCDMIEVQPNTILVGFRLWKQSKLKKTIPL